MANGDGGLSRRRFLERSAFAGVALAGGPGLLAACGSSSASPAAGKKHALTGPVAYHAPLDAWVIGDQVHQGDRFAAKQLKLGLKTLGFAGDSSKELTQIDQLGTLGVKVANTVVLDAGLVRQLAAAGKRNGLYYASIATMGAWVVPCEPGIDYYYQGVAFPPDGAYLNCRNMFKALGGKGTFIHLSGSGGVATSPAKDRAVDRALREFPNIQFIGRGFGNYNRDTSHQVFLNLLSKAGGKVDAVYCQSDDEATGVLDALRANSQLGKTLVAGADGIPEFIDAIIAGTAFGTEAPGIAGAAGYTMVQGLDAAAGHRPRPTETLMSQDLLIIDNKASAQAFKELYLTKGMTSPLFDYPKMSRVLHPTDWDPQLPLRTFDPQTYWGEAQGVKKPAGYELPKNYTDAVAKGERAVVDKDYADHLKNFPLREIARASRTKKTAFEQLRSA